MNKMNLAAKIAAKCGLEKKVAKVVVDTMIDEMKESLLRGEEITFHGFGSIAVKIKAAKNAYNFREKCMMTMPEHKVVCFKAGKDLSNRINKKR